HLTLHVVDAEVSNHVLPRPAFPLWLFLPSQCGSLVNASRFPSFNPRLFYSTRRDSVEIMRTQRRGTASLAVLLGFSVVPRPCVRYNPMRRVPTSGAPRRVDRGRGAAPVSAAECVAVRQVGREFAVMKRRTFLGTALAFAASPLFAALRRERWDDA